MSKSQEIVDFLNELTKAQPEILRFLNSGIAVNDKVKNLDTVIVRPCLGRHYLTFTGIISAIGEIVDEPICSVHSFDKDGCSRLVSFVTESESHRQQLDQGSNPADYIVLAKAYGLEASDE